MDIRIHIGAHKTATTQFQDILERAFVSNAIDDIAYFPRDYLREKRFTKLDIRSKSFLKFLEMRIRFNFWKKSVLQDLLASRDKESRFLISEENILGNSFNIIEGFYPNANIDLQNLKRTLNGANPKIFLSIRSYSQVLISAYCQCLRDGKYLKPFEYYKNKLMEEDIGWQSLVKVIVGIFPKEDITVWTFETYIKNPIIICNIFSGSNVSLNEKLPDPDNVKRLTVGQVKEIENYLSNLKDKPDKSQLAMFLSKNVDDAKYSPLDDQDVSFLNKKYLKDINNIRGMGVTII